MYLDKAKIIQLMDKAKKLQPNTSTGFNSQSNSSFENQIKAILTALSGWLKKNPNLTNGAAYGNKLSELRNSLSSNANYGGWMNEEQKKKLKRSTITLLKKIDAENKSVFIVHGRDHEMRNAVQSALHGLGIPNVVLDREDDEGQTIIEKFEKEASRCEYAVILCSADDEGRIRVKGRAKENTLRPRARQNVVLELGYFLARLGRQNLFVLHPQESIEQASDFSGIIYQTYDKAGLWKAKLVRELKKAGFKISAKSADRI